MTISPRITSAWWTIGTRAKEKDHKEVLFLRLFQNGIVSPAVICSMTTAIGTRVMAIYFQSGTSGSVAVGSDVFVTVMIELIPSTSEKLVCGEALPTNFACMYETVSKNLLSIRRQTVTVKSLTCQTVFNDRRPFPLEPKV